MTGPSDADLEHHKALEVCLLIRSGLFDRHLIRLLDAVTDRMADPAYRRPPPVIADERPAPPTDWPVGGWFDDPHAG